MLSEHRCNNFVNEKGCVIVDGREYPMASEVIATEDVIQQSIRKAAKNIADDYRHLKHRDTSVSADSTQTTETLISDTNPLIILSVLKGSYIFTADFVRYLGDYDLPHVVDFIRLSSYNSGTESSGNVAVLSHPKFQHLQGKHVLILEDVCDTGLTLQFICEHVMQKYEPKSLKTLVFMNKVSEARKVKIEPDYTCLEAPNKYIIGYGFDVNDRYRNLRHVFVLKEGTETKYTAML